MKTGQMLGEFSAPLETGAESPLPNPCKSGRHTEETAGYVPTPGLPAAPALHVAATSRVHAGAAAGCGPRREQAHRPARAPAGAAPRRRPRRRPPARPRPSGAVETDLAVRAPAPARRGGLSTRAHTGTRPQRRQDVRARGRGLGVAVLGRAPGHVGAQPNGSAPVQAVAGAHLFQAWGHPLGTDLVYYSHPDT